MKATPMPIGAAVTAGIPSAAQRENTCRRSPSSKKSNPSTQIRVPQEIVDCLGRHAAIEAAQIEFGVDGVRHVGHDRGLVAANGGHYRADLAVEVGKLELIEIGDRKTADAQACECQQVRAPDTTHSRDGNPLGPQGELLPVGEPAQITIEGRIVRELMGVCMLEPRPPMTLISMQA